MSERKTDVQKIMALRKAGWRSEKIASEMRMEPTAVDRVIGELVGGGKGEAKKDTEPEPLEKIIVSLSREDLTAIIKEAAEIGARAALDKMEQEKKKMRSVAADRRLHNTKLLLRNYRMLKENSEHSVFGRSQMEESAADILCSMMNIYDDEVIVDAIKRSATRTAIMVSHIDAMIGIYRAYCEKSSNTLDLRRYEIIYDMYISDEVLEVKNIAEKRKMSQNNVYKDLKIATERLSALFFGVDGLSVH